MTNHIRKLNNMKKIAFIADAVGAIMNGVAIAQACQDTYKVIFIVKPKFDSLIKSFGFTTYILTDCTDTGNWNGYVKNKLNVLRFSPSEQIKHYVSHLFKAIVYDVKQSNFYIEKALQQIQPDLICLDDVIMIPAIKRFNCPWIRIVSCNETEIHDKLL